MASKAKTPPPIDRPLSRAYLREFKGWSTAYPPGVSEPNTLRTMHNCAVDPSGALRIRPGLRHVFSAPAGGDIVGDFEHFYTASGARAILFAVRQEDATVEFVTAVYNEATDLFDIDASITTRFPGAVASELAFDTTCTNVRYLQIDNKILALSDSDEPFRLFTVNESPSAIAVAEIAGPPLTERPYCRVPDAAWIAGDQSTFPSNATWTTDTLVHSTKSNNIYTVGYFCSFNNEIGETQVSGMRTINVQRPENMWEFDESDDSLSPDQIVVVIPLSIWDDAVAAGAVSWNLYMLTWSNQDPVPLEGVLLRTNDMTQRWMAHTPLMPTGTVTHTIPNTAERDNFTKPSHASQGLVAGDRIILVRDPENPARIQWSSNLQGDYLNFSASRNGGYKTLTSGNLLVPSAAELWQNPQSVDTIIALCAGVDGVGGAYYMNANTAITTQSQSTLTVGFEETTATPGTVSPYATEVLNNALYHPLDNNIMKSTASNYNINHAMMADQIQNIWLEIPTEDKVRVVSSQMDSALYYLVNSPTGTLDADGANGNQVWICDTALSGAWSCWDVTGTALRKLEIGGQLFMSIVSGDAIYVFDQEHDSDDVWDGSQWTTVGIPWEAVTNTQGANKAHDAWAMLQQVDITFGNFTGECVYGIRGYDVNGEFIELKKHYISKELTHDVLERFDQSDRLLVRRIMREWELFWRSADKPKNRSYGSISYVQYRYTPSSVNTGGFDGTIESFEYGDRRAGFDNGIDIPFADTHRP